MGNEPGWEDGAEVEGEAGLLLVVVVVVGGDLGDFISPL